MTTLKYQVYYERNLPHVQPPGSTLFITFRLSGSLPGHVVQSLLEEARRAELDLNKLQASGTRAEKTYEQQRRLFGMWDDALHAARDGPTWLQLPQVADLVAESMHYRDKRVYHLDAYCIMPNHVHMVFAPLEKPDGTYHAISSIMHSLKRHTARQANLLLEREGGFWQHESYDHVVRDESEWRRIVDYTINNPVKAGLVQKRKEWRWTYARRASWLGS